MTRRSNAMRAAWHMSRSAHTAGLIWMGCDLQRAWIWHTLNPPMVYAEGRWGCVS
jgi:hypothetical protein